jgi:hypothetical protein
MAGLLCMAALAFAAFSAPSAQAAAPAWEITSITTSVPIFHRTEPETITYHVKNVGDAPSTEDVTVTDSYPGTTLVEARMVFPCPLANPVVCTFPDGFNITVPPGEEFEIPVRFTVDQGAPDSITNTMTVTKGGAAEITASKTVQVEDKRKFDVLDFKAGVTDESEDPYGVAGGHGSSVSNSYAFPLNDNLEFPQPVEAFKDSFVDLPIGFFGNPSAAPRCPTQNISFVSNCPAGSQVGYLALNNYPSPLYNVKPDRGYAAQFVASISGTRVSVYVSPRPRSEGYGLTLGAVDAPHILIFKNFEARFFGFPQRENGTPSAEAPFLTNPVDCSEKDPQWGVFLDSWETAAQRLPNDTPDRGDPNWNHKTTPATPVTGCDALKFEPTFGVDPDRVGGTVQADQPTGLGVSFKFPQTNDPTDINTEFNPSEPQTPEPKDITVKLPAGLSVSPSSAGGLVGCSDLAEDPAGDQVHLDTVTPVTCPDASKIGTVTTTTPLVAAHDPVTDAITGAETIGGDIYLIKPHVGDLDPDGDQDGILRLLIQIESPRFGINFKLPGIARADKQTGQLTATFADNPQLPASTLRINFKSGPRAPLATPITCGSYESSADLTPWGTPEVPNAQRASSFVVGSGANGTACPATAQDRPFHPALGAGSDSGAAGAGSPFNLTLSRADGEQELRSVDVTLPKGFSAKLTGIPYCSDAAIAAANGRSGAVEQASPSCPAASRIGSVTATAGPGASPFPVTGDTYLAGPYKGAPLSLVFVTPAVAGPFDLGNVVIRAAAFVDRESAQVSVKTDPIPQMLDGIPLRIRSISTRIDRSNFALNPTNCSPQAVVATAAGASGASAAVSTPFQVGACAKLAFNPKLALSLKGGTKRRGHPVLKAVLTPRPGDANLSRVSVALPSSELLDNTHIKTICTRVQFAADQCPAESVYGFARATTPLVGAPLEGPVYLRSSSNKLPDLVADLRGQIDVAVVGRIDSAKKGGIRTTFENVPDTPVTSFVLELQGGAKGLLENSKNLCAKTYKATVLFNAQNGLSSKGAPPLASACKKRQHKAKKRHPGKHKRSHR